jgi:hypothetical protein
MRDSILSNETLFSHAINVGFVSTAADLVETVFAGSALGIATDLGGLESGGSSSPPVCTG